MKRAPTVLIRLLVAFALAAGLYLGADRLYDLPPEELEFRSEIVAAGLTQSGDIEITGTYTFFPGHPVRRAYRLLFPTRNKDSDAAVSEIAVSCGGESIPFRTLSQGIEYTLEVVPRHTQEVRIRYVIPGARKVTYITRTANLWPHPLQQATFVLLDRRLASNYHGDEQTTVTFCQFRPRHDFEVTVRR